jgi:hypothetical protein
MEEGPRRGSVARQERLANKQEEQMPADLVPNDAIPQLAARVDAPEMLKVLQRIQRTGFILNGSDLDPETARSLQRLAELGLVDPGYNGRTAGRPYLWTSNGNGSRVLWYLTRIPVGPHYEVPSSELAAWLEQQGEDRWWNVDGDPLLTGRLTFPCPADELAAELRQINRPLLVQAKKDDAGAKGQPVHRDKLNELVEHFGRDRLLYLCWKEAPYGWLREWLLVEDSVATEQSKADEAAQAT